MTYTVIYAMLPIAEAAIRGYCFYRLVRPFLNSAAGGRAAFFIGPVYFFVMMLLHILSFPKDTYTAYGLGSLIMLLLPSFMGVMAYQIIQHHRMFYISAICSLWYWIKSSFEKSGRCPYSSKISLINATVLAWVLMLFAGLNSISVK